MQIAADSTLFRLSQSDTLTSGIAQILRDEKFLTSNITGPLQYDPIPLLSNQHEWQWVTLGISLLLIAIVRVGSRISFINLQKAFFSLPLFRQMVRDDELFPQGTHWPLLIVNVLVTATFFFNITERSSSDFFSSDGEVSVIVFKIIGILIIYYLLQFLLLKVVGVIFNTKKAISKHRYTINYYQFISSLFLIPVLIFYIYSSTLSLFYFSLVVWISIYLIRLARGMIIVLDVHGFSRFQIFLYICALEILPVIVLVKFFVA
jgi:hypothetical protein